MDTIGALALYHAKALPQQHDVFEYKGKATILAFDVFEFCERMSTILIKI
jgi:hypothetical protein